MASVHVVELFYSEHCPSCPEARQVVRRFASERADVIVLEHDVAVYVGLANRYGLIATPALVIDGGPVMYGVPHPAALEARVDAGARDPGQEFTP